MMTKRPGYHLGIVKACLSKTVSRGATVGEEAAAVDMAVKLMAKYDIPRSAVASVWPRGWGFDGKRVKERTAEDKLRELFGGYDGVDQLALDAALRRMRERTVKVTPQDIKDLEEFIKHIKVTPQDIKDLEEFIKRHRKPGAAQDFRTKTDPRREQKSGSIGEYARQLLRSDIAGIGPYSYGYILGRILDRYPNAKTTVASLRWYENEMRNRGVAVPRGRPAKG